MKTIATACICFLVFLSSCSKKVAAPPVEPTAAVVTAVRIACGETCSSEAWLLTTQNNRSFEAINLPVQFRVHQMKVRVVLNPRSDMGPAGKPVAEVLRIVAR